jgi:4-hydroxy-tetrahydrodipicolinate synthase
MRDLAIDVEGLASHCSDLLRDGCDGVVVFGTTGEATSFTVDEKTSALEILIERGVPPERMMVGTGCAAVPDSIALTRHATQLGVGGVLVLPPFYFKGVTDEGVIAAYDQIIQGVGDENLRLYLYHFPHLSGVALSLDVVEKLKTRYPKTVVGLKDSSGDAEGLERFCGAFPQLKIFPGTESLLLESLRMGSAGCISASFNATGPLGAEVMRRSKEADAESLQARLTRIRRVFESEPIIAGLKATLARRTGIEEWSLMRPPLVALDAIRADRLAAALEAEGVS